jgi:hypothetical protein
MARGAAATKMSNDGPAGLIILRSQIVETFQKSEAAQRATRRLAESVGRNFGYRANSSEITFLRESARELRETANNIDRIVTAVGGDE